MSSIEDRIGVVEAFLGFQVRPHQNQALTALGQGKNVILHAPTGCHAPGQLILMLDGSTKRVEDIKKGDLLMGPDSKPRRVTRLIRGRGRMVRVLPKKGEPFVVNEDHILTLVRTGVVREPTDGSRKRRDLGGELVDVKVKDWEAWSSTQKHVHKLKRIGVTFRSRKSLPLDPYMLGIIVGDGSIKDGTPGVTTADPEIEEALVSCAARRDLYIREEVQAGNAATTYRLSSGHRAQMGRAGGTNSLTNDLRQLGLWGKGSADKFIPKIYKVASRESRLELLAGLIDADGYLHHNNHVLTTASEQLAEDVAFVARSLGLAAYIYSTSKRCQTGYVGDYFRVSITGDNSIIPCRLERKTAPPRLQKKDSTRTGFALEEIGEGEFFGFSLTGDGRFLLGDFTITHNSGKTVAFQGAPYVSPHPGITVILYPLRALVKDQTRRFVELGLPAVTLYGETPLGERSGIYDKITDGSAKFLLTTPESFDMNRKLQDVLAKRGVNVLAVDEAHAYEEWADGFRPVYRRAGRIAERVGVRQFLLCSATLTKKGFKTATETIGRDEWTIVQVPPVRKNLHYRDLSSPSSEILTRAVRGDGLEAPGIVFFTTIKCLNETAELIERRAKRKVLRYHGSMSGKERKEAQEAFMTGDTWIFATKAFGMGIDKDNIRNIVHCQVPNSVLSYAQECVHGDTPVMTQLGNRPAKDIKEGEHIIGFDPTLGMPTTAQVTRVVSGETNRWVHVLTSSGDELVVTPNHPVMVGKLEIRADDLQVGDRLTTLNLHTEPPARVFTADLLDADSTYVDIDPQLIETLRESLTPSEMGEVFKLKRAHDYTAYKRGKAALLAHLQEAADRAGLERPELYNFIRSFKSRSGKRTRLPVGLDCADLGWFVGIVATDGYVYRSDGSGFGSWKIKLTNTNRRIINKFVSVVEGFGLSCSVFDKNTGADNNLSKKTAWSAEVSSPVLCDLLGRLGIQSGRKSTTVDCPPTVTTASREFRSGYAAGVIDGDGSLSPPRDTKPQGTVRYHSGSRKFAAGFTRLLASLGVVSRLSIEDYTKNVHIMECEVDHGYSGEVGRFQALRAFTDRVAPYMVKEMFPVKAEATDPREVIGSTIRSTIIEIHTEELAHPEPTYNWTVQPFHLMWTSNTLTHNCGRAGRDGLPSYCWLTQEEHGQAAHFLTDISVPSYDQTRRVWNLLQSHALDYADWFDVDWVKIADSARLPLPAVQACVSWLFTGKMLEKKQKKTSWKFIIDDESDGKAIKYKRKTPEILDLLRGEAMVGQGPAEFQLKPEILADTVGALFSDWRAKLRRMNELGIITIVEPPTGRSYYRFLHNAFEFAQGEKQLRRARTDAFNRLSEMKDLQAAKPEVRQKLIENAISLKLTGIQGLEILDCDRDEIVTITPRPKVVQKKPADTVAVDPFADPLGADEFLLDF
ncbi:MAG: LAGLIDADG family homing endonuclease [Nitrospira sp.]